MSGFISQVDWKYDTLPDGRKLYILTFRDLINNTVNVSAYSTHRGAACAETRFHKRMTKLYHAINKED